MAANEDVEPLQRTIVPGVTMLDALRVMSQERVRCVEDAARIYLDERGVNVAPQMLCRAMDWIAPWVNSAILKGRERSTVEEWDRDSDAGTAYSRRTAEPVSFDLLFFARAVVSGRSYRYVAPDGALFASPPGAPAPIDWAVWAHRVLDLPYKFETTSRYEGLQTTALLDPHSVALSGENAAALPPPRQWDKSRASWIDNPMAPTYTWGWRS